MQVQSLQAGPCSPPRRQQAMQQPTKPRRKFISGAAVAGAAGSLPVAGVQPAARLAISAAARTVMPRPITAPPSGPARRCGHTLPSAGCASACPGTAQAACPAGSALRNTCSRAR
ncbi:hypothetical protein G6F50_017354 [Rhizopus delemar]|uniref:Uncharacterized protein n=1 Tax=Rhizopus delemar TaxID=936053 RepID=A0A9P6XQV1_9FUNG|nr:hypothetical protein G6F50_017354 [Rhizopus delemar]